MKVFFNASVIIAAMLSSTGGSSLLFEYIKISKIMGVTSQIVIDEILGEDKFKKLKRSRNTIEQFIAGSGLLVRERITNFDIVPYQEMVDIEDAHLIAGANLTKCEYLVTLDKKHLLNEGIREQFLPLKIVSPKELIILLLEKSGRLNTIV